MSKPVTLVFLSDTSWCDTCGYRLDAHLPPELSGGEAQRVAFARALVKNSRVLLADEPTGNLDTANRDRLLSLVSSFHKRGGTVVMVMHDAVAAETADSVLNLDDLRKSPLPALSVR